MNLNWDNEKKYIIAIIYARRLHLVNMFGQNTAKKVKNDVYIIHVCYRVMW